MSRNFVARGRRVDRRRDFYQYAPGKPFFYHKGFIYNVYITWNASNDKWLHLDEASIKLERFKLGVSIKGYPDDQGVWGLLYSSERLSLPKHFRRRIVPEHGRRIIIATLLRRFGAMPSFCT